MAKEKDKEKKQKPRVNPELVKAEKQYRREKMIVEARPRLKKIGLFLWIAIDIVLIVIFIGYLVFYLVSGVFTDRNHVARVGENISTMRAISEQRAAVDLQISQSRVFTVDDDRYDLFAEVENSNLNWYATFDYYFSSSQGDSERKSGSVMPGKVRPIAALRQEFPTRPNNVELVLEDLTWHRVPPAEITDITEWMGNHNNFIIEDADYGFDVEIDGDEIPRTSFSITNNSPYSYWNAEFIILIERAGNTAGVNTTTLSGFESGETREVNVNWFGTVPSSGTVTVIPNINYFDEDVYMSPPGNGGTDLRDELQED